MKKTFITLTIAVGAFAFGQVGVNTTEPKSTLEIKGSSSPTVSDGILIPRYTVAELAAKDAAYAADQNGTLVFVTSSTTGTTVKTSDISAAGFYYYDNSTSKWKAVTGSVPPPSPFIVTDEQTTSYTVQPTDDFVKLNILSDNQTLTFPTSGIETGKKVYVSNKGNFNVLVDPTPRNAGAQFNGVVTHGSALFIYLGNGEWDIASGF